MMCVCCACRPHPDQPATSRPPKWCALPVEGGAWPAQLNSTILGARMPVNGDTESPVVVLS